MVLLVAHFLDDVVRERLPALLFVRICFVRSHSQAGVEEQHALLGPVHQRAVLRNRKTEVVMDFGVNVAQRGRDGNSLIYRKAQALRLVVTAVSTEHLPDRHRDMDLDQ